MVEKPNINFNFYYSKIVRLYIKSKELSVERGVNSNFAWERC